MDTQSLRTALTRLHSETADLMNQTTDKHFGASDKLATRFNELLSQTTALCPNDAQIMGIQEIPLVNPRMPMPMEIPKVEGQIQEIKIRSLQLADILEKIK